MDILIAYDIADTQGAGARRLQRTAQICSSYGTRVQFSVFECRLSPERCARLLGELRDAIDPRLDSVIIYRFDGSIIDARTRLGRTAPRDIDEPWII
ncbi:MAG: CRISPR-associated endonuclease Cas2 [Iamia sp.]